jgi:hypothetical protein
MSAPSVSIRRLSATAHFGAGLDAGSPESSARIGRLLAGVVQRRLDRAVQAVALPAGTWCVRRLDVPVQLDLAAPDPAVEEHWAAVLAAALAAALREPGRAVRYGSDRDALADLVAGISVGRTEQVWAWRQLDLLRPGDPDPGAAPREALLAAITRHPEQAAGAVVLAIERAGLAALHRTLGVAGWTALATVVGRTAGASPWPVPEPAAEVIRDRDSDNGEGDNAEPSAESASRSALADLATRLVRSSRVATAARTSTLRPPPSVAEAWAVLVAAEVDPTILRRATAPAVLARIATALEVGETSAAAVGHRPRRQPSDAAGADPRMAAAGVSDRVRRRPVDSPPYADPPAPSAAASTAPAHAARARPTGVTRDANPAGANPEAASSPAPPAPDAPAGPTTDDRDAEAGGTEGDRVHPTEFAGLLFLIATAPAADVPEAILDEPAFAARTLPWVLHHVATGLEVPTTDPAAAAFAGLDPGSRPPWQSDEPPTDVELEAVRIVAHRWSTATAAALRRTDDEPTDIVRAVIRRAGLISHTPGWIDVRMPVDEVDLDIRQAGLDVDPGWVPWLGTVVRYVYE